MDKRFLRSKLLLGDESINLLANSTVLVVGLGGVGGYVVESLARTNVGKLILVDYDNVDITNINRQLIALNSTVDKDKVDVFKARINDINPRCQVITHKIKIDSNNLEDIFDTTIDFVVDACDDKKAKKAIIDYCLLKNILLISAMGTGKRMDPSKLVITTLDKTYNDPLAKVMRGMVDKRIQKKVKVCLSLEVPVKTDGAVIASCVFVPATAGLLIGNYVINNLLKQKELIIK